MSEDEDADHAAIDREIFNRTTTTGSGRLVIPPAILKYYETGYASMDI